ncbi:DUF1990 family protein [Microbacterium excoecariae]|uniref:DUF1990 family protein n=1 Tax=Microbacterium excoecariae TaxID=2715210 RepID=UPI00140A96FA|nr:DUF1990 family protein [Microbacterium excoecariae]NHI17029.1 DUF1990 family protein [Microbacterium excoecariae]
MRRATFRDQTVDYAAVGASQAADLLQYPPENSIPAVQRWRIGSGEERFRSASDTLLSWSVLTGAGLAVTDVRPSAGPSYTGVSFDGEGHPVAPSRHDEDQRFTPDGIAYVSAGATAHVHGRARGKKANGDYRVIFVAEEPRRTAYALGTVDATIVSGEVLFSVDWRDDDEVWFEVRAFDIPVAWSYRAWRGRVRRRRRLLNTAYLRAISPLFA